MGLGFTWEAIFRLMGWMKKNGVGRVTGGLGIIPVSRVFTWYELTGCSGASAFVELFLFPISPIYISASR